MRHFETECKYRNANVQIVLMWLTFVRLGVTWLKWLTSWSLKGFLFPECAKLRIKDVYSASFWGVLPTLHSQSSRTDFHAWYAKRRGSVQGCACLGLENKNLTFSPRSSRKTAILDPLFSLKPLYNGGAPM